MRTTTRLLLSGLLLATTAFVVAQQPRTSDLATKLMAFDANKDGKLTKAEVTDERLIRLFEQIDADKKGTITKEQIEAFAAKNEQPGGGKGGPSGKGDKSGKGMKGEKGSPGGGGFPGGGNPGGFPGGGFPGGPGGMGGFAPPPLGTLLPNPVVEQLKLTNDQKKKLEELQKDIDTKLEKLMTEEQRKQFKEMKERGPGRGPGGFPGGPGGGFPGGPGGPGGAPGGPGGPGGRGGPGGE